MSTQLSAFKAQSRWQLDRPHILVAACSDGRLQEAVDEFLNNHLGIFAYDRLYLPGGPGALSTSGVEYVRSDTQIKELKFLVEVHEIEEVVLLFHGPAEDGPNESICADYARVLGQPERDKVGKAQADDLKELLDFFKRHPQIKVHAYRCEVDKNHAVSFVNLLQT